MENQPGTTETRHQTIKKKTILDDGNLTFNNEKPTLNNREPTLDNGKQTLDKRKQTLDNEKQKN